MPDISLLPKLAVFFGVRIDDLFCVNHDDELERIDHILSHEQLTDQNFAYAKRTLEAILRENETDTAAIKRLASIYLAKNHRDALYAGKLLEKAMHRTPEDAELFTLYRRVHGGDRFAVQSENEHFFRVCAPFAQVGNPKLLELLIEASIELRDCSQAEIWIDMLSPAELRPLFRGDIRAAEGNLKEAVALWDGVPNDHHKAQYEAGERFNRIRAYERAITCYENAFRFAPSPRDLSALYSLAFLHTKLCNNTQAIETWERILSALASDHHITDGETVDWAKREIEKLKSNMAK